MSYEARDTVREEVLVAVHDTLTITKTVTIRENEAGDTIRMTTVTDRERIRSVADMRSRKEEVKVVADSVYVAQRDSVRVQGSGFVAQGESRLSGWLSVLRMCSFILLLLIVLVILVKVKRLFNC